MDNQSIALAIILAQPVVSSNAGHWDWEANYVTSFAEMLAPFAAAISWIASKFSTVPALRAAHA